jgi:proteic killer suppression protein
VIHIKKFGERRAMAVNSFKDARLLSILARECPKGFPAELAAVARRNLVMLDAALRLDDLRAPPANRLEALKGDRAGQHSIRVNDQFRLCFRWTDAGPEDVEFVDYH